MLTIPCKLNFVKMENPTPRKSRNAAADFLRVLAFFAVSLYHLFPQKLPGGFLGVSIFFLLAGFYGVRSFPANMDEFSLIRYYRSRLGKLWPPLLLLLALSLAYAALSAPALFVELKKSMPSALLGFNNFYQLSLNLSYFDLHGQFRPLTHLWALSVEMQFYLFFPLIQLLLARYCRLPKTIIALTYLLLAGLSVGTMTSRVYSGVDLSTVYYHSFCRAFSFMIGAAGGLLSSQSIASDRDPSLPSAAKARTGSALAFLTIFALFVLFFKVEAEQRNSYPAAFLATSLLALFWLVLSERIPTVQRLFEFHFLFSWLASRSYELYLYQYSVMVFVAAAFRFSRLSFSAQLGLQIVLVLVLAELSYLLRVGSKRFVLGLSRAALSVLIALSFYNPKLAEQAKFTADLLETKALVSPTVITDQTPGESPIKASEKTSESTAPAPLPSIWQIEGIEIRRNPDDYSITPRGPKRPRPVSTTEPPQASKALPGTAPQPTKSSASPTPAATLKPKPVPALNYSDEDLARLAKINFSCIGDSVLAMAAHSIRSVAPHALFDAVVSRQIIHGAAIISSYAEAGQLGEILVIALGTNGDYGDAPLAAIRLAAGDRPLIFVNTVVPQPWEQSMNQRLQTFVANNTNCYLVDWYGAAKTQPSYFYSDATHPIESSGAHVYARLILDKILEIGGR